MLADVSDLRQAIETMGKVFTPEEVMFGQIPQEGDHLRAAEFVMDYLFRAPVSGIEGGLIYGSVADGRSNVRSDIDFLVLYDPEHTACLDSVAGAIKSAEGNFLVPFELTALSAEDVEQGFHTVDPLFLRHLLRAEQSGKFCYGEPATALDATVATHNASREHILHTIRAYCAQKTAKLAKGVANERYVDAHLLQRALEVPKNLGRKVLMLTRPDTSVLTGNEITESFAHILRLLQPDEGTFESGVGWSLGRVAQFDHDYTQLLRLTIDEPAEMIDAYTAWLEQHKHTIARLALDICQETSYALDTHHEAIISAPQP